MHRHSFPMRAIILLCFSAIGISALCYSALSSRAQQSRVTSIPAQNGSAHISDPPGSEPLVKMVVPGQNKLEITWDTLNKSESKIPVHLVLEGKVDMKLPHGIRLQTHQARVIVDHPSVKAATSISIRPL